MDYAEQIMGLHESRLGDAQKKWVDSGKISAFDFNLIARAQPSGSNYKYLPWCLKQYIAFPKDPSLPADQQVGDVIDGIIDPVKEFDEAKSGKDLNSFKSVDELKSFLEGIKKSASSEKKKYWDDKASLTPVYTDDIATIWNPTDYEEMRACGCDAWCVYRSEEHWDNYTNDCVFAVINLNGSMWAVQILAFDTTYWDDQDHSHSPKDFNAVLLQEYGGGVPEGFTDAIHDINDAAESSIQRKQEQAEQAADEYFADNNYFPFLLLGQYAHEYDLDIPSEKDCTQLLRNTITPEIEEEINSFVWQNTEHETDGSGMYTTLYVHNWNSLPEAVESYFDTLLGDPDKIGAYREIQGQYKNPENQDFPQFGLGRPGQLGPEGIRRGMINRGLAHESAQDFVLRQLEA